MKKTCTCIIPFFNEGKRLAKVLKTITRVKNISEIICVDDGSKDYGLKHAQKLFPNVKFIRSNRNLGKTGAVKKGLKETKSEYVILMDADLNNLKAKDLENAVTSILENDSIDMIILRRVNSPLFVKSSRGDVLTSGERILKTKDLNRIIKKGVHGYQLEMAINHYMQTHSKNVFWMPSEAMNTFPIRKFRLFKGIKKDLKMYLSILQFIGLINFLILVISFARRRYHPKKKK